MEIYNKIREFIVNYIKKIVFEDSLEDDLNRNYSKYVKYYRKRI